MVHYTTNGTLSGTLRTYQEVRIPYTVPYMVHKGLFRPPKTHSMVHSTVSCTLDGTFVPIQRHLVTYSGSPLGTQWYTDTSNNVPKNDRPLARQQGVSHTHVTWLLVAPHQTPSGRRVVFLASPTVQLVTMASGRCVVFLAPRSPVLSVP